MAGSLGRSSSGRLRVFQISSYGLGHPGGLEVCAEMLTKHLPKLACEVVWAFGSVEQDRNESNVIRYRVIDFLERCLGVPMPIPRVSAWWNIARAIRRSDVVLVHDFMYFSSALAMLCCVLWRKPFVLMVHVWRVSYGNSVLNFLQSIAHWLFGRPALRYASAVLTCSRENLRQINDRPSAEAFFVANGIESEPAYAAESTERMQGPDRVTRPRVCFAGRCVEKKGLSLIHEAAMEFPEVEFTIAGEGPIDPERWGLPNVKCLGWIGRAALHRLFRESDLLLLPSRGEGFPLTVQEAMAAGTPGAIFEETWRAWGDDRSKFHILSDEHYLVDLRKILDAPPDPARRQEISEYAIRNWTWERAAKTYAQVLHKAHRDSQRIIPNLVQAVS